MFNAIKGIYAKSLHILSGLGVASTDPLKVKKAHIGSKFNK